MDQAVDAPVPRATEGTVESDVAHAPTVSYAAPAPVIEYVECVAPSLEYVRPRLPMHIQRLLQ